MNLNHSHLTAPTELDLSPSKARAHTLATTAWSQVTTWLSTLFSSNTDLPPFERNPEVLAYLQSLMHANIFANHAQSLLCNAQAEQLSLYQEHRESFQDSPAVDLLKELSSALTPEGSKALDSLAEASVTLSYMPPLPDILEPHSLNESPLAHDLAAHLLAQSTSLFTLKSQLSSLNRLCDQLNRELEDLRSSADHPPSTASAGKETIPLSTQISHLTTSTKHLSLKLNEYTTRISALEAQFSSLQAQSPNGNANTNKEITIESLRDRSAQLEQQKAEVRELEERLSVYAGLPADVEASREEVRRVTRELEEWKEKRDELFGGLGSGGGGA